MATSYTFFDGQTYPTKCFPARTSHHLRKDGAGHWLVAYRQAEEQKHRNVTRRKKSHKESENRAEADAPHDVTLDGPFLLRLHCVDEPSELCSVNISEQNLNSVKPEDLKEFNSVAFIDASINSLSLGSFSSFVSLRELNLSLNGISNMTFDVTDFPQLKVLDLSYNSVSSDCIVSLGWLPRLKVLHLTGNCLRHLPSTLGAPNHYLTQVPAEEEVSHFKALEVLMLDDNKLSSAVFNSLTNLKRLTYLNLEGNRISEVPFMQTFTEELAKEDGCAPNSDEDLRRTSQSVGKDNWEEHCQASNLPLPGLQFLNLANNKISEEEALMAVALFPMLCEIDIHSNPLTTQRRGDPPLLTYYLQERRGITIKRKKTQVVKVRLTVSTDPTWKVEEKLPKVSKKPLQMNKTRPAPAQTASRKTTGSEAGNSKGHSLHENTEQFFITQLPSEERNSPEDSTCYKMMTDVKLDPDVLKPVAGIQTAVRMLEHTLRNLNVYRDSKPKLDSIQIPYREREKRIKELPPLKPVRQPAERIDEMIKEIKECTPVKVVALDSAIRSAGVNKDEHKEALSLLRDMKTKYKLVHEKTMEQAEGGEEAERHTHQTGAA
ncbi:X-ray radiation resistance-associated protein 1 [Parambassis ranga]|uniref:X-ray radiation resistance-associated protein 1 n=1 Tax=Parambassis ranga TaxID=210632 RepID=A0A6P7JM26_9TELE|nr:X-ray radiation resistance-associated protein 1 [Parambassis ranga]